MTNKLLLNGQYELYSFDSAGAPIAPDKLYGEPITATVPGNVELDYMSAGLLSDLYVYDNIDAARTLERKDFWYVKQFDFTPDPSARKRTLTFDGVDCIAEYFVNGTKIGASDNALASHSSDVTDVLVKGVNTLAVHIFSAVEYAKQYKIAPYNVAFDGCYESLNVRKSAASYGWDILPRAVSAGIWKDVYLTETIGAEIDSVYIATARAESDVAVLVVSVNADIPDEYIGKCKLTVSGNSGCNKFSYTYPFSFNTATVYPYVYNPKLWYPKGSGEQNLYDISVEITCNGKVLCSRSLRYGIRTAKLVFGEEVGQDGNFYVEVNGKKVRIRGVDHTPINVYHSRDLAKTAEVVNDIAEVNCNLVRIWGGGVYENDLFYDLCDEKGILVWQDVMLACHAYPQTDDFLKKIEAEVKSVAMRLRNHTCLLNWCGSNETDWAYVCVGLDPNDDKVTRNAIAEALCQTDTYRTYLPSTPYFSRNFVGQYGGRFYLDLDEITEQRRALPQEHYWWHRDDFKNFTDQTHKFIAEIGVSGAPSDSLLNRVLPEGWDFVADDGWKNHSYTTESKRTTGMDYLFAGVPQTNADMAEASRLYQAEAYKYIVEKCRIKTWQNGIVLWNLRDGYPIFASSLVDFDGWRKPAYKYVAASYEPLQCLFDVTDNTVDVYVVNDGTFEGQAYLRVEDNLNTVVFEGEVSTTPDSIVKVASVFIADGNALISSLTYNGQTTKNFAYVYKNLINFKQYQQWFDHTIKGTEKGKRCKDERDFGFE